MSLPRAARILSSLALTTPLLLPAVVQAEPIVNNKSAPTTENAVFTDDGRYFVASANGILEIKPELDSSPNCVADPIKNYSSCTIVPNQLDGDKCQYLGMTTDGTYLYAACSVYEGGVLDQLNPPDRAKLVRVLPGTGGDPDITSTYFDTPVWYNGMAVVDENTILATASTAGSLPGLIGIGIDHAAVDRIDITDADNLTLEVSAWLPKSSNYAMPNGIQYDGDHVYFIGGQNLFRINLESDGSAGRTQLLYRSGLTQVLDDFAIVGDRLAVAEIGAINGISPNSIVMVSKRGSLFPQKISTRRIQLSSIAVDPGLFGPAGTLIGTSFFQGGIHSFIIE